MIHSISLRGRGLFLSIASAACMLVMTQNVAQAAVEGCNPVVIDAMQKKAQAQVAYDTAVVEEIIDKPDSVLATTCFNQAAGVSANSGGSIFSGDFTAQLIPLIETGLIAFFDDYADAAGEESTVVDYAATALINAYSCNEMEDLWTFIEDEGIQMGTPFITFDELLSGTLGGGAGGDFINTWNAAAAVQNIFSDLNAAVVALPGITAIPPPPPANATACATLITYGIIPGPCP